MKNITGMLKCSFKENCLDQSIFGVLKIYELRTKIIQKVMKKEPVPDSLINAFSSAYKKFSKYFFSKKTVDCIFEKCRKYIPKNLKSLDKTLKKIEKLKSALDKQKKTALVRNYKKMIKLLEAVTIDFSKKYQKKFLV